MSETKSDVLLEVKNLHKAFDKHVVLNDVNTTVRKGDVIAIIGPSGCGKSKYAGNADRRTRFIPRHGFDR